MLVEDGKEWDAQLARFRQIVRDWGLDPPEAELLLGLPDGSFIAGRSASGDAELRLRLLVELDVALRDVFGKDGVRTWLHDEPLSDGVTPFEFLTRGVDHIRAMRAAAMAKS